MRARLKQSRVDLEAPLDMLLGQHGLSRRHPADERQPHLLAHGVFQLNAARGTGH